MVCGITSFVIPVITSLVAIICGHISRGQIKKSNGSLTGKGMALTGLICGYTSLIVLTGITCTIIYQYKESKRIEAEEIAEEIRRGKEIYSLVVKYEADHGTFPDTLGTLVDDGYISSIDHLQPTRGGNWVYFQGMSSKSSKTKYFIRSDHHHVVIHVNGNEGSRALSYTFEPRDFPVKDHTSVRE